MTIYGEDHLEMVREAIADRCKDRETAKYVQRFASRAPCLEKAVADTVAVCYSRGCGRELVGLGEGAAEAFAQVVVESEIDTAANGLNARAWLAPVLVSPHLDRRGLLALDMIGAERYTARLDGSHVEAALWQQGDVFIELDDGAWRYFDNRGDVVREVFHACGTAPAVHTVAVDNKVDPWITNAHNGLADATLDVAYLWAWTRYVRQVSGVAMIILFAEQETLKGAAGQAIGHAGLPFVLPARPGDADAKLLDRAVPAAEGLAEIQAAITMAISAEGIPPGAVSLGNVGSNGLVVAVDDDRLALLRDRQVPFMWKFEMRLWPEVCDLLRGSRHRLARKLPSGDEVRDALQLNFPDLASAKQQLERIEAMKAGLPFGITNPTDDMMAARPELTRRMTGAKRKANLEDYIENIRPLVERNTPAAAPEARGVQTIAQEQGRAGGQASGQTRAAQAQEKPYA